MKVKEGFKVTMFNMEVWVDGGNLHCPLDTEKSESGSLLLKPFFHFFHNFILPKNLKLHLLTESCKG